MALTPQQEKFAQAVASGMNQSDAYRESYNVRKTTKIESINNSAYKLMIDPDIKARVEELRAPIVKAAQLTLEAHLNDLKGLRNMATKAEQYSAAISAEVARGKAAGLYVDNVKATVLTRTLEPLKDDDFLG
jgi:hypothetical protein